ncbi:SDR family oxidoreductase [Streptomyces lavendulae]|uniref:SDR family oxidoreductase n=1 Tax=Streptomyces lavendulae TaxID=1914 RepID=UPI0036C04128
MPHAEPLPRAPARLPPADGADPPGQQRAGNQSSRPPWRTDDRSRRRPTGTIRPSTQSASTSLSSLAVGRARPENQIKGQCVPRRGQPEDIAALVAFLVGPSVSFITGQSVHVDGGWLLH